MPMVCHDSLNGPSTASVYGLPVRIRDSCGKCSDLVDIVTLALTHGLIALALWRMLFRPELDAEDPPVPHRPWNKQVGPDA